MVLGRLITILEIRGVSCIRTSRRRAVWARSITFGACIWLLVARSTGLAATVPFTESFVASSSNWADVAQTFNLDYIASGGPDGNGFISDQQNFSTQADGDSLVLFRRTRRWEPAVALLPATGLPRAWANSPR